MVWSNIVNKIVNELICSITVPLLAFGYNKPNICSANMHIPAVQGKPISIEISSENDVFCFIVFFHNYFNTLPINCSFFIPFM